MYSTLKKLFDLLDASDKKEIVYVAMAMTFTAFFELVGVTSIFPFISVIANPSLIHTNKYYQNAFEIFGISSDRNFIIILGCTVLLATVASAAINIYSNFKIIHFSESSSCNLANRLLRSYMDRPYSFFLTRNSSDLTKNVLSEVNQITSGVILPLMQGLSRFILMIALFSVLLWVNPMVALSVVGLFGGSYVLIFLFVKKKMTFAGKARMSANKNKHQAVSKAFGGIKEIKLLNNSDFFLNDFRHNFKTYARYQVVHQVYSLTPRYILEVIAFGSVVGFMLILYQQNGNLADTLPTLSLFAIVGYKILPALQQVYNSVTRIKFFSEAVNILHRDIFHGEKVLSTQEGPERMKLEKEIEIKDLVFHYQEGKKLFDRLSLRIEANTTVGFVGTTGAGKTTLVDILMGLLEADEGSITIDGVTLNDQNINEWRRQIGYVPQRIYLSDDSVSNNIAFGIHSSQVDQKKIEAVAKMAKIHDFVLNEMPQGYETHVGDRGVRLSGGQSQRLGIARALYRNPSVLILDEATSALDNLTEGEVINMIKSLNGNCTIIMIAHRLSTVENCQKIFYMEHGKVLATGTFKELIRDVPAFKELAGIK